METVTDRLTRYFLRRLARRARFALFARAVEVGMLDRQTHALDGHTLHSWSVSGEGNELLAKFDKPVLRRRMAKMQPATTGAGRTTSRGRTSASEGIDGNDAISGNAYENVRSLPKKQVDRLLEMDELINAVPVADAQRNLPHIPNAAPSSPLGKKALKTLARAHVSDRRNGLAAIAELAEPASVPEIATVLLVARAIGETLNDMAAVLAVVARSAPFVLFKIPTARFEKSFGELLASGILLPGECALIDGAGGTSLSGEYRRIDADPRRKITSFSGRELERMDRKILIRSLGEAVADEQALIIIADETRSAPPIRAEAAADIVFECAGVDRDVLVELLQIVLGVAPRDVIALFDRRQFEPTHLGLHDLAVAIRRGRSLDDVVRTLEAVNADNKRNEDEAIKEAEDSRKTSTAKTGVRGKSTASAVEVITPAPLTPEAGTPVSGNDTKRIDFRIETLSGYGEARTWALELGQDLTMWQRGAIPWTDMSTRLLLSGLPGTGKTTFAKALCNSLQLPLVATSVGRWLEPGYLGDVLQLMTSAFSAAQDHKPCILFIDEIDNIGKRGGAGAHEDYWHSVINRLLELLDGASKTDGVVFIAATNRPEDLDPALLRSGRLERHVTIELPDIDALLGILAHHLGDDIVNIEQTSPGRTARRQSRNPAVRHDAGKPDDDSIDGRTSNSGSGEMFGGPNNAR